MNNFGCVLAVMCHWRYFVRLPTMKYRMLTVPCLLHCSAPLVVYSDCCIARFIACDSMRVSRCIGLPIRCNYHLAHYSGFFEYVGQFLIDFNQIYRHSSVP